MKGAKRINLKDIVKLETLSDDEHIVLVYLASRVMRLSLKDSLPFLLAVQRNMKVSKHSCQFSPFRAFFLFSCCLETLRFTPSRYPASEWRFIVFIPGADRDGSGSQI